MISRYFKAGNRSSGVVRTVEDYPTTCPTQLATIREDCYKTTLINPSEPCMQHQAKLIPWDQVKRYFSDRTVKITVREGVKRCREVRGPEPCYIGSHTRVKRTMAPATVVSPTPMDNVAVSVAELMSWMTTDNITRLLTTLIREKTTTSPDEVASSSAKISSGSMEHRLMLMILSAGIHINFDPTFMSYLDIDTDTAIMFAKKGDDFTIMFQSIKIRAASLLMHRMQAGIDITYTCLPNI